MLDAQENTPGFYFDYLLRSDKFPQSIYHKPKIKITEELIESCPAGATVLDAGCGSGYITAPFLNRYNIVGIDHQDEAVEYCKRHYPQGAYFKSELTGNSLPVEPHSVDVVLFHDAIEHFNEPLKALELLATALKPGGKIVVSTINYSNPLWLLLENTWHRLVAGNCRTYSKDVHPTRYTASLLREHCQTHFDEIELRIEMIWMELFFIGTNKKQTG